MVESISSIDQNLIAQILGPGESIAQLTPTAQTTDLDLQKKLTFDDILQRAIGALEEVSKIENDANLKIQQFTEGKADLADVMIATAKMNLTVQLAVTVVTSVVNTFKEMTQMQI